MSFVSRSSSQGRHRPAIKACMLAMPRRERRRMGALLNWPGCAFCTVAVWYSARPTRALLAPAAGGWWPAIISDFNPKKAKHQLTCESGDSGDSAAVSVEPLLLLVRPASCAWPSALDQLPANALVADLCRAPCALQTMLARRTRALSGSTWASWATIRSGSGNVRVFCMLSGILGL